MDKDPVTADAVVGGVGGVGNPGLVLDLPWLGVLDLLGSIDPYSLGPTYHPETHWKTNEYHIYIYIYIYLSGINQV